MTKTDNTYNGWTNYATWRVNLEWFDENFQCFTKLADTPHDLAIILQEYIDETLESNNIPLVFEGYITSFLADVNYIEIAQHLLETEEE